MTDAFQGIAQLEDRRFAAMTAGDLIALDALLADDLHYVHANGMVEDKIEFLRKIRSGERRYLTFTSIERRMHREGICIFVFGEAGVAVDRSGDILRNRLTYTAIYRDGAGPRFFAWHAVKSLTPP
jgi:ketosteroid isomerase-like protein